jgi:hypothetical protein
MSAVTAAILRRVIDPVALAAVRIPPRTRKQAPPHGPVLPIGTLLL